MAGPSRELIAQIRRVKGEHNEIMIRENRNNWNDIIVKLELEKTLKSFGIQ